MEENYYETLQVNKNASPEIIEKAYKTLVKKYHPDLQEDNNKTEFETKIKKINEAYEILSNSEKRKNYDLTLKENDISISDYNNLYEENINLKNNLNILKQKLNDLNNNMQNNNSQNNTNYKQIVHDEINNAVNKAYYDAYIQDLKNRGYKIKYKKTWKDFLALIITILVILVISFILWHIPFVKNHLIKLYEENSALQAFVNLFRSIFK